MKKPAPPPQGASNPFGKSTILEQKAQALSKPPRVSPATTPLPSPRRTTVAPTTPVTTPKAVRTLPGPAGNVQSPVKRTPTKNKTPVKEEEVTPKAVRTPRGVPVATVVVKRKGGVTDEELDIVAVRSLFFFSLRRIV